MRQFRYTLEKYNGGKSRFHCPNCNRKEFVKYIDNETKTYLDDCVGKCNRIEKCGYHYTPKQFFEDRGIKRQMFSNKIFTELDKEIYFFDETLLLQSLHSESKRSNLFRFLTQYFDEKNVQNTFEKYMIGHSDYWEDSVVFWQIDMDNKIRSGKIMHYNSMTGKRDKKKFNWFKIDDDTREMKQCFFGVHLLKYFPNFKIGIVESEKTALICDLYFDEKIIWLASGGLKGLNEDKFRDLSGRVVILFPDLSCLDSKEDAFEVWKKKAFFFGEKLRIDIRMNDYLERFSSDLERENQDDLGDFILRDLHK